MSLAHHGVLFLDELQEIPRHVLDALRQPLEDGRVVIARAATAVTFPAQFTLIGAMNPCPCGRAGDPRGGCYCASSEIAHHQSRLSGPLADRIDMQVRLSAVPRAGARVGVRAENRRPRCALAWNWRARGSARAIAAWRACGATRTRRDVGSTRERRSTTTRAISLRRRRKAPGLSARAYHRVLKVARTIADLDDTEAVAWTHVAEALRYRPTNARDGELSRASPPVNDGRAEESLPLSN